jgi:hypothetical protein
MINEVNWAGLYANDEIYVNQPLIWFLHHERYSKTKHSKYY